MAADVNDEPCPDCDCCREVGCHWGPPDLDGDFPPECPRDCPCTADEQEEL